MADERRNPDAMSYEECRAECETLQREVGDDSTVHHSWDGNVHYWRGRLGSVRQDYDRVSDRTRGTIAALRARVADLESALTAIVIDTRWAEDWHPKDPQALRYALVMTRDRAREALAGKDGG